MLYAKARTTYYEVDIRLPNVCLLDFTFMEGGVSREKPDIPLAARVFPRALPSPPSFELNKGAVV